MDTAEAVAREGIRHVIARYNYAGDRGRLDELVACFTEDGVMELPDLPPLRGREAIHGHLAGVARSLAAASQRVLLRHHVASLFIDSVRDDQASASACFSVYTEIGLDHWGVYRDRLRRVDGPEGEWLLAHRKVRVDGAVAGSRMVGRDE
ncbi:MAG: nuclear transport factor 2 family protein [Myxococcota bacterium]